MNDLIMMILGMTLFFILQFGVIGIIHFWNIYRYGLGISKGEETEAKKVDNELLRKVLRFKPKSEGIRSKDEKRKFGRGFERRVWK